MTGDGERAPWLERTFDRVTAMRPPDAPDADRWRTIAGQRKGESSSFSTVSSNTGGS